MKHKRTVFGAAAVAASFAPWAALAAGPADWQMLWPDAASPTMERINELNTLLNLIILGIVLLVLQLTADDVIHAWALPALGIKTDTVPGRLNETWVQIDKPGIYYGQCSELCGVNHAYMPIEVHAVPPQEFEAWIAEARQTFAKKGPAPKARVAARAE